MSDAVLNPAHYGSLYCLNATYPPHLWCELSSDVSAPPAAPLLHRDLARS